MPSGAKVDALPGESRLKLVDVDGDGDYGDDDGDPLVDTGADIDADGLQALNAEASGATLGFEAATDGDDYIEGNGGNDTIYGLAGAVWTADLAKAQRVARRLRHGTIWINDYHPYVAGAEWGGFKQSGVGRELGSAGFAEYLEHKHIWHNLAPAPSEWFPEGVSQ